jgi:hypothetical protein
MHGDLMNKLLPLALLVAASTARSEVTDLEESGVRYDGRVAVDTQVDDAGGITFGGDLVLRPSDRWEFGAFGGRTTIDDDEDQFDSVFGGADLAYLGDSVEGGVVLRISDDSEDIRNSIIRTYATFAGSRGLAGIDVQYRESDGSIVTTIEGPRGRRSRTVVQDVTGYGYGAHGVLMLNEHWMLFGDFMLFDYDVPELSLPFAERFAFLQRSVLTIEEAFLDSSLGAGLSYAFGNDSISLEVMHFAGLDSDRDTLQSQIKYDHGFADRYRMELLAGVSDDDYQGDTLFGGIRLSMEW